MTPSGDVRVYIVTNQNNATLIVEHVLIINQYPRCSYPNYRKMHSGCIDGKGKYIPCKHLYHLFMVVLERIHIVTFASIVLHGMKKNLQKCWFAIHYCNARVLNQCVVGKLVVNVQAVHFDMQCVHGTIAINVD